MSELGISSIFISIFRLKKSDSKKLVLKFNFLLFKKLSLKFCFLNKRKNYNIKKKKKKKWIWRASLSLPSACKADVILTTPHTHLNNLAIYNPYIFFIKFMFQ